MRKKLKPKRIYRVKKSFDTIFDKFEKDEELVFIKESYSHYDGATIYIFSKTEDTEYKQAFIEDNENKTIFEYIEQV